MPAPNYPALWSCIGMIVGLYGLLYGYAVLHLDRAMPIIEVGLLGKLLGPLGLLITVFRGEFPPQAISLVIFNDLIWWLPFALFLYESLHAPKLRAKP